MYKGRIISSTAVTAETNIPFATVWNTNSNTSYDSTANNVILYGTGYYDVAVSVNLTSVASSPVAIQLYADGNPIAEAIAETDITATTGIQTLTIVDTIKVAPTFLRQNATLSVRATDNADVLAGVFTVEMRK